MRNKFYGSLSTYSINVSCRQVSRGCLARLKRFGWLVALTVCNVAAALPVCNVVAVAPVLKSSVIIRLSDLMKQMNARPTSGAAASPISLVTAAALGSSLVLADSGGSLNSLGCLGHSLYRPAFLSGISGWPMKPRDDAI